MKEKRPNGALAAITLALLANASLPSMGDGPVINNSVIKEKHPWDGIQLPKAARKGKTPEEIQAMRKSIYEKE